MAAPQTKQSVPEKTMIENNPAVKAKATPKMSSAARAAARMDARLAIAGPIIEKYEELARDRGLTQVAIAEQLGCSRAHISRLVSGNGNWTLDTVGDLLEALGGLHLAPVTVVDPATAMRSNVVHPWVDGLSGPVVAYVTVGGSARKESEKVNSTQSTSVVAKIDWAKK